MGLRMTAGQDAAVFFRFRAKEAARKQAEMGKWSTLWASLVESWHDHIARARNSDTWAAQLSTLRPPQELQERRWAQGRPFTRSYSGWIRPRWYEAVARARAYEH